jgi:hypothetical protein
MLRPSDPGIIWTDVCPLHATRSELQMAVAQPRHRSSFAQWGLTPGRRASVGPTRLCEDAARKGSRERLGELLQAAASMKGPELLLNKVRCACCAFAPALK